MSDLLVPPRPSLSRRSTSQSHSHSHSHHVESESTTSNRGSQITLIGLYTNIGLTAVKAIAGYALNSSALVADAAHSLSDLLGDFVVLACWKVSRRPPNTRYQFGFGKYEAFGSLLVSVFLVLGAIGIGTHSFHTLLPFVWPSATPTSTASTTHSHSHHHHHHSSDVLDPNAAWFALASVLIKEWLYRATIKVAKEENSNVLEANALHHRSDAFSGIIALIAIATSSIGFTLADPAGGLVVACLIAKQGLQLALASVRDLLDHSPDPDFSLSLLQFLHASPDLPELSAANVVGVRTFYSGAYRLIVIDVTGDSLDTKLADRVGRLSREWSEANAEIAFRLIGS